MPAKWKHIGISILCMLLSCSGIAQRISIKGKVVHASTQEALEAISVVVKGSEFGTFTRSDGTFTLVFSGSFPVTLQLSSVGYAPKEWTIAADTVNLILTLENSAALGQEVVLSATRVPTKILESPVSIERFGSNTIKNSPATSYYDIIGSLKGVDVTTSGLNYKTFSTRGFNGSGSPRVNQQMDGMDNQSPGLNFSIGSFIGLTDLDVDNVELLPGASSALYGPGGMNGTIIISSKDPFKYQGLSVLAKQGVMNTDQQQRGSATGYYDYQFRFAKVIKERFAFKLTAAYTQAQDWLANDSSNYLRLGSIGRKTPGNRTSDPNYDGVNVYGDETTVNIKTLNSAILTGAGTAYSNGYYQQAGSYPTTAQINQFLSTNPQTSIFYLAQQNNLLPDQQVSRTGYAEKEVIDPSTWNLKLGAAFHYKINKKLQAQLSGFYGGGNTVYTSNNRYSFRDIKMGQYKFELKHPNWFVRAYTTQEYVGHAYSATITAQFLNEGWKSSGIWYPEYIASFTQAKLAGLTDAVAHGAGRTYADIGRPDAGTTRYQQLLDSVRSIPIPGGGRLLEKSSMWMFEGQYDFSQHIKFADILVGVTQKRYMINSESTIFIDTTGPIPVNELGAYIQATKKLFDGRLTLSASGRYDKNENFKGKFTPRFSALVKTVPQQFLRISYQTAYRFPTMSQQFIRLNVGDAILLGGLPWINDYMGVDKNPTFNFDPVTMQTSTYTYQELQPETMRSFEIGYKANIHQRLLLDAYAYVGSYSKFLGRTLLIQPTLNNRIYSIVNNSNANVKTRGYGISANYRFRMSFVTYFNFYSDRITNIPTGFVAYFNTPKYRINAGISKNQLGKKQQWGMGVNLHWQDQFFCESEFAQATVPAFTTIDAQISYQVTKIHTVLKLGGTNILNHYYQNAAGNPYIGAVYYFSIAYNHL
jgi:outer membrane receptor protein involved in Fe transport